MDTVTESPPMPRKPKDADAGVTVKLDRRLYDRIQTVARFHGQRATPWLEDFLRPLIQNELAKVSAAIQEEINPKPGKR